MLTFIDNSKITVSIKKFNKIIILLLSTLIVLGIVLFSLLSLSSVQTQFAKRITKNINTRYNTDISIYKAQIKLNGGVSIENILIQDHHNDTLLFIKEFKTSLKGLDRFLKRDYDFTSIGLNGVKLNLKQYLNESESSFQVFISKLPKTFNNNETLFTFKSKYVKLIDSQIIIEDLNKKESKIQIDDIDLALRDFDFDSERLNVSLESLHANSDNYGELNNFQTDIKYSSDSLLFDNLLLDFNDNKVKGEGAVAFKGGNLTNLEPSEFNIVFSEVSANLGRINFLKPFINKNLNIDTGLKLFGSPNNFNVELELFDENESLIQGDIQIKNIFNAEEKLFTSDNLEIITSANALKLAIHDSIYRRLEQFVKLEEQVKLRSNIFITDTQINLNANIETQLGSITPIINGERLTKEQDWNYNIDIGIENFNVGKVVDENSFGLWTGSISTKGIYNSLQPFLSEFNGTILRGKIGTKEISNFNFSGTNSSENLTARLSADEEDYQFDFKITFNQAQEHIKIEGEIEKFNLSTSGLAEANSEVVFSSKGFRFEKRKDIQGESQYKLELETPKVSSNISVTTFDDLTLEATSNNGNKSIFIKDSDALELTLQGDFKYKNLGQLVSNMIDNLLFIKPTLKQETAIESFSFDFQMKSKLIEALYPNLSTPDNFFMSGVISSDIKQTEVVFDVPILSFEDYLFKGLHFEMDSNNLIYNSFLSAEEVRLNKLKLNQLYIISTSIDQKNRIRAEGILGDIVSNNFEVNFSYNNINQQSFINFELLNIRFKDALWSLKDKKTSRIVFKADDNTYNIEPLLIHNGNQSIGLEGAFNSTDNFYLEGFVQDVVFQDIFPATDKFDIQGILNSKVEFYKTPLKRDSEVEFKMSDLIINSVEMGDLEFTTKGNTDINSYQNNIKLMKGENEVVKGKGGMLIFDERITLDMDVSLDAFDLSFLSALGKDKVTNITSLVTGEVNFWGPISKISHKGSVLLNNFNISIPYTNTAYGLEKDARVTLYDQTFKFEPAQIFDTNEGTSGILEASLSHLNFLEWIIDLNITSDRLLSINRLNSEESLFYGSGYLDGEINLVGPITNSTLDVQGATADGTLIKIPWAESNTLADISFIDFLPKSSLSNSFTPVEEQDPLEIVIPKGLEMNFDLDVNNKAEIEIVVDQESESTLIGKGAGNLLMEINTEGKFNIWGDFITYEGIYNFKNLGFIDKKFKVNPGGTIVWDGNPQDAQINIEAVYQVPGGANPAILIDNPNFNRKIPTDVLIQLQGSLLKPNNPLFEINFPNTDGILASEINYKLADEQRRHLQAISLLSQGVFISDVSFSTDGLANNFYEKASDFFSSIMGRDDNKLNVGVNYLRGDKRPDLNLQSEDRIGVAFETQISDKILFNGKVGVPVGGVEETTIIGNVQIDFILNEDGTLRAKVFNRENEFRYINDDLGYTQGLGLSYQVDFKTFKDIIRKIKNQNIPENDSPSKEIPILSSIEVLNENEKN